MAPALLPFLLAATTLFSAALGEYPTVCQDVIDSTPTAQRQLGRKCKYPVSSFVVLGERNSGTNFLSQLIKKNVKEGAINYLHEFPKHWSATGYHTAVPKRTLYLLSIRNPYDWLASMKTKCYCCLNMMNGTYKEFLRRPYTLDPPQKDSGCPPPEEMQGPTGQPLQDMMALRTAKLHMHLHMGMAVRPYFVAVRMEDLWCRPNPAAWLKERLSDFCMDWKDSVAEVAADARAWLANGSFPLQERFEQSWYFNKKRTVCVSPGAHILRTVNKGLHTKLERRMGYQLRTCD